MTRHLDLRTGRTVWGAYRAPRVPVTPLRRDARTEVLVVGMGISGAMVAETLTAAGRAVILVDRRGAMQGSTHATTALVQFEIDTPLTRLTRQIGRDKAERAWRRSRLAVDTLGAVIGRLEIRSFAAERPSLYLAGDLLDADALAEEAAARRAAGLYAEMLDARRLRQDYGIDREAAILSAGNLALDPMKLTSGLLRVAASRGARLHAPAEAVRFELSAEGVEVGTAGGPVIRAEHVVLATGYELTAPVAESGHRIISTWAIATKPQPRRIWGDAAMMWEASDPYLYLRTTHDGRVICGGEDEDFEDEARRDALLPEKAATIAEKLSRLLPQLDTRPEFAWTGSFGSTATGLPIIRRLPRRPRMHAVLGYGGNGITYSRIAAELIASELDGRRDADADLYR